MLSLIIYLIATVFFRVAFSAPRSSIPETPLPLYDVVVVGGGPGGLSAASALGRVQRSVLLIDDGQYRMTHRLKMLLQILSMIIIQATPRRNRFMISLVTTGRLQMFFEHGYGSNYQCTILSL